MPHFAVLSFIHCTPHFSGHSELMKLLKIKIFGWQPNRPRLAFAELRRLGLYQPLANSLMANFHSYWWTYVAYKFAKWLIDFFQATDILQCHLQPGQKCDIWRIFHGWGQIWMNLLKDRAHSCVCVCVGERRWVGAGVSFDILCCVWWLGMCILWDASNGRLMGPWHH